MNIGSAIREIRQRRGITIAQIWREQVFLKDL